MKNIKQNTLLIIFLLVSAVAYAQEDIKMTTEDMLMIEPGRGYVMTWYDHSAYIDCKKVFCEIYKTEKDMNFNRGLLCFELIYGHHWQSCDCKPIDNRIKALRYRYKHDKEFRNKENSDIRESLDRMKLNELPNP